MPPERILIVDDDELIVRALSKTLEAIGYETRCYHRPELAVAGLVEYGPQVVISDYMMPGMDGIAFLKEARRLTPNAARILCTAANNFEIALEAVNSGEVYRIIHKPWHHPELVSTINQAAEAARLRLDNDRLTAEIKRQNGALREINVGLEQLVRDRTHALLEGLIAALDYRDAETQWHSRRVSLYAKRLAQQLRVEEIDLMNVEHGALLHDIGKIGIRDSVLLKPGPLSPDEWVEMKRHPELGWALLRRVEYLHEAARIVLEHQEKYDGTGYPAGLKGDEICIGARIFHVVDTLDAITTDRPYRKGRPFADALAEIKRCVGTQFDPRVVEAFLAIPELEWHGIRHDVEQVAVISGDSRLSTSTEPAESGALIAPPK